MCLDAKVWLYLITSVLQLIPFVCLIYVCLLAGLLSKLWKNLHENLTKLGQQRFIESQRKEAFAACFCYRMFVSVKFACNACEHPLTETL